ncbi:ribosome-binding factor A, partial [Escherichia coli]|nr:ribosome-binding factor A [Escherichia coli]
MKKSISVLRKESQIKNFISTIITNELTNANIYNPT